MEFDDLDDLYEYVEKTHKKVAINEVQNVIKKAESEVIDEVVYSTYEPKMYERRYEDGGLSDVRNMQTSAPIEYGNTIEMEITNETPLNPPDDGITRNYRLDEAVEKGGFMPYYEYPKRNQDEEVYTYLKPRPFTEMTEARLFITKEHEKAYKKSMKSMGIDIK